MSDPSFKYKSTLHGSTITNLAADRANIAVLHSAVAEIGTLTVQTGIQLPDGALLINSSGTGAHLTTDPNGGVLTNEAFSLKTLTSTDGSVVITPSATEIDLSAMGVGNVSSVTPVAPPGPGEETLIVSQTGAVTLKNIASGGPSVSISADANRVIITGPTLADAGACDAAVVVDGAGPTFTVRGIDATTGIQLSSNLTCIEIGTNLVAGTGITLTPAVLPATDITVTNSDPASSVTLASAGGTETLVNDGTGPALATKGLTAGTGITLSSNATSVTVTNSDTGSAVTLTSTGAGSSLVQDGTGPALAVRSIVAGTNIGAVQNANDVTVSTVASPSFTNVTVSGTLGGTGNSNLRINDIIVTDAAAARYPAVETATSNGNVTTVVVGTGAQASGASAVALGLNTNAGATAVAVGASASATGSTAVAIGNASIAGNAGSVSIGTGAHDVLTSANAVAIGNNARGGNNQTVAIGINSNGAGSDGVAIGNTAFAQQDAVTIGHNANASATSGIAIGVSAASTAGGGSSIAVGDSSQSLNTSSIAVGKSSTAQGIRAVAVGAPNTGAAAALATDSIAIGTDASVANVGIGSVAIGNTATVSGASTNSVAIGTNATASTAANVVAIGNSATSSGANSVVVGNANSSTGASAVLIGDAVTYNSTGASNIGIGTTIALTGTYAKRVAIGSNVACGGANTVCIGTGTSANSTANDSVVIGSTAQANAGANFAVSIGYGSILGVNAFESVALLGSANDSACVAIGAHTNIIAGASGSVAIGDTATVPNAVATSAVALGQGAAVNSADSIAIGHGCTISAGASPSSVVGSSGSATVPYAHGFLFSTGAGEEGFLSAATVAGSQRTYAFFGPSISFSSGFLFQNAGRPIRVGGTPVIRTAGQILGTNTVCVNAGATTFRMPANTDWDALFGSFGAAANRFHRVCSFWITNLTGNTLLIDITTLGNSKYTLWDNNTNTGFTVNKSIPNNIVAFFRIGPDSTLGTYTIFFEGSMTPDAFS
jgi:hypothetical protein